VFTIIQRAFKHVFICSTFLPGLEVKTMKLLTADQLNSATFIGIDAHPDSHAGSRQKT
jgi:hypothetical protein